MRVPFLLLLSVTGVLLGGCSRQRSASSAPATTHKATATVTHSSPPLRGSKRKVLMGAKGSKNGLAVLTWHRIAEMPDQYTVTPPAKFAEEMEFLHQEGANVMRLEDAVRMVKAGQPLPPRAVSLGFDDGFRSSYTQVFPLLKKYNWPATLYVYPDWISSCGISLTWDELREMQKSGLVDVQSHTMSHPDLVKMKGKHGQSYEQRLHHEIFDSKKTIEEKLGTKVTQLAYPYGFYNKHVMDETQKAGYDSAWTVNAGPFSAHFGKNQTWMSLPRFLIYRNTKIDRFTRYAFGKPLDVSRVFPAANSTQMNPTPTISVHIDDDVDPTSVQMRLAIIQKVDAKYNAKTRVLTYTPMEQMREGTWTVSVSARDKKGVQKTAAWAFVIKDPTLAPTATDADASP